MAEIYFFTQEYDKALPIYEALEEEKPESVQVLNRIVGINVLQKKYEKAMQIADAFLAKFPENSPATIIKAKIYISQGYLDLAENVLSPVADNGKEVAPIVMLAELYLAKKDGKKAVHYYKKALEHVPDDIGIMMKLADYYLKSGNQSEAIASYEKVLEQKADFLPAMNNLAFLYTEEGGKLDRALELASAVSKELPENPDVADTLGWIYVKKQAYSQAEPYLQTAMDAKPDNPTIMFHMGMLQFGQGNIQEAEELLADAIQKGIQGAELDAAKEALGRLGESKIKFEKAMAEKESGNAAQAILLFEEILDSEGFNSDAAAHLAILYADQNRNITRALELAQQAYDAQPGNPHVADALGWVYYQQGSLLMAKKYVEQAVEKDGQYGPAHMHLGAVYLKKEEPEAAKKAFDTAKSMKLSTAEQKQVEQWMSEIEQ